VPIKAGSGHLQTKVRPSKADVGTFKDYFLPSYTYKPTIITPLSGHCQLSRLSGETYASTHRL